MASSQHNEVDENTADYTGRLILEFFFLFFLQFTHKEVKESSFRERGLPHWMQVARGRSQ